MHIFILEDDSARVALFQEALLGGSHDLTVCEGVEGKGGAKERFDPPYDLILLDHDLGGIHSSKADTVLKETGYQFVKWMTKEVEDGGSTPVIIHSYNPDGAKAMETLLRVSGWNVTRQPFGSTLLRWLENLKYVQDEETTLPASWD